MRGTLLKPGLALAAALSLFACQDGGSPLQPETPTLAPALAIVDGSTGGNGGVFFLPPLLPSTRTAGTFDPHVPLRLEVTWAGSSDMETFSVAAGSVTVKGNHYQALWRVPASAQAGDVFGITALAGTLELGHVDVEVAANGRDAVRIRRAGENVAIQDAPRTLPIKVFLSTEAVPNAEAAAEAALKGQDGVIDADVVIIQNDQGGSGSLYDTSDPDAPAPLAAKITTAPGQAVSGSGGPVSDFVLTLLLREDDHDPIPGVSPDQQLPYFFTASATTADGQPVSFTTVGGQVGAEVLICQPLDIHSHLTSAQVNAQRIFQLDGNAIQLHGTQVGDPRCEGYLAMAPIRLGVDAELGSDLVALGRRGLRRLAGLLLPTPLMATHGGLTTLPSSGALTLSDWGALLATDPSLSGATVPAGAAGSPTVITIQANVATGVPQGFGGDDVRVAVSGANSATLTVGSGVADNGDGTYTATYTPANVGADQVAVTIADPETTAQEPVSGSPFTSAVSGVITVSAQDGAGAPFVGATVTLSGTQSASTTTDAAGHAAFQGLAAGPYAVQVSAAGFDGVLDSVAVGSPGFVPVSAVLEACPALATLDAQPTLNTIPAHPPSSAAVWTSTGQIRCATIVDFVNRTSEDVDVDWIDFSGTRVLYATLAPGQSYRQQTWPEHIWLVVGHVSGDLAFFQPLSAFQAPAAAVMGSTGDVFTWSANGHAYQYVPDAGITWTDAETAAAALTYQGMPGHLATLTSAAEQAFVEGIRTYLGLPDWRPWIGLWDANGTGTFGWVTGEPFAFTHWGAGEPTDIGVERWVEMFASGAWNNNVDSSGIAQGYLVEYEP